MNALRLDRCWSIIGAWPRCPTPSALHWSFWANEKLFNRWGLGDLQGALLPVLRRHSEADREAGRRGWPAAGEADQQPLGNLSRSSQA